MKYLILKEEIFNKTETTGHFENPIIMVNTKLVKKQAKAIYVKNFWIYYQLVKIRTIN